jgi:hypothetical protein
LPYHPVHGPGEGQQIHPAEPVQGWCWTQWCRVNPPSVSALHSASARSRPELVRLVAAMAFSQIVRIIRTVVRMLLLPGSFGRNLGDHIRCDRAQSSRNCVEEEPLNWSFTVHRGRRAERACFASRGSQAGGQGFESPQLHSPCSGIWPGQTLLILGSPRIPSLCRRSASGRLEGIWEIIFSLSPGDGWCRDACAA